jgi:protein gp37
MSEETKIQWADSTWNPWIGCTKVSPGCAYCYATWRWEKYWGKGVPRHRTSEAYGKAPARWNAEQIESGAVHHGAARPRIFPSLCDWLDEEVPIDWLADFLRVIHQTPHLDWLLLTKRPENWRDRICAAMEHHDKPWMHAGGARSVFGSWLGSWVEAASPERGLDGKPPQNVSIGISAENQEFWEARYLSFVRIPAVRRFVSLEPLLGAIDCGADLLDCGGRPMVHWVIIGGESGPHARPCDVDWIRDIIGQCRVVGVPCFVKQLGRDPQWSAADIEARWYEGFSDPKGGNMAEWPFDLRVRQFPKSH